MTILGRRFWLIILVLVLVILSSTLYTLTQTELFEAESRVLLRSPYAQYSDSDTGGSAGLGVGNLNQSYDIETEIERIKNPELVKETRERLAPRMRNVPMTNLNVHQIGRTAIIGISIESGNPQFCSQMSQELADAYIEHTRRMRQISTEQALEYVDKQAGHAKDDLDAADNQLSAFKQANRIVDMGNLGGRVSARYDTLLDQIEKGNTEIRTVTAQLKNLDDQRKQIAPYQAMTVVSAPTSALGMLQSQLTQLESDRLSSLREYTETSHRVRDIDSQIVTLQEELKREYAKAVPAEVEQANPVLVALRERQVNLEANAMVARASVDAATGALGQAEAELNALPAQEVRYAAIERQEKVAETAYADLLNQAQVLRIQKEAAVASAFVLTRAEVPTDPISPQIEKNIITGCLVGLFLGLVAALISDRMDDTFRNPKEIERLMKIPVLGLVRLKQEGNPIVLTEEDERSPFAEAFRALRANIRFSALDGRAHTILITSTAAGEGKSTCAANLAIASARSGQRVVLVDTDLRRPALHGYFGLDGSTGLTNVLVGDLPLDSALQDTLVPGLRLLAAGALPPNPVVMIESEAMQRVIHQLTSDADLVIFDSPPVLIAADSQVLSSFFDATLLVVETRTARREMAMRAMELLRRADAKPVGVAINKARQREQGYYYYYYYHYNYYSYGYGYGYGPRKKKSERKES